MLADRFTHLLQRGDPLAKGATADNLFLWRRRIFKFDTGLAIEFANRAFHHHGKVLANIFRAGIGQIQGAVNTHLLQAYPEAAAYAPDLIHRQQRHQSTLALGIAEIHNPLGGRILFCRVVSQLCQCLGGGHTHADSDANPVADNLPHLLTELYIGEQFAGTAKVEKGFIYRVNLHPLYQLFKGAHHPR